MFQRWSEPLSQLVKSANGSLLIVLLSVSSHRLSRPKFGFQNCATYFHTKNDHGIWPSYYTLYTVRSNSQALLVLTRSFKFQVHGLRIFSNNHDIGWLVLIVFCHCPGVALKVWNLILEDTPDEDIIHMMWAVMLLNMYGKESIMSSQAIVDKKFRVSWFEILFSNLWISRHQWYVECLLLLWLLIINFYLILLCYSLFRLFGTVVSLLI